MNNIPNQIKENKLNNLNLIKDERTGITLIEGRIYDDFIKKGPKRKKEVKNFTKKYNGKVDPVQLNAFYHNNNFKKKKKKKSEKEIEKEKENKINKEIEELFGNENEEKNKKKKEEKIEQNKLKMLGQPEKYYFKNI